MTFTTIPPSPFLTTTGQDVEVLSASTEYTVAQAAKFLHVSERHLNRLLDAGRIVFRQEGSERMVLQSSLLDYEQWRERGHAALDRMMQWNQEMGLYND